MRLLCMLSVIFTSIIINSDSTVRANEYEQQVRSQLLKHGANLISSHSYELSHNIGTGRINRGGNDIYTLNLIRNNRYAIIAVCDNDCSDIDLKVYDENNNLIAEDVAYDDYPLVNITPRWSGPFKVVVTVPGCRTEYCYFGVAAFRR